MLNPIDTKGLRTSQRSRAMFTRRDMLAGGVKSGLILASASLTLPAFLQRSALAIQDARAGLQSAPGEPDQRILLVVQFSGGNDGLNMVVPFGFREYYDARPGIAIPEDQALRLDKHGGGEGVGLHPAMTDLHRLYDDGLLSILQGVGYPNPNRSHFKSMDIWHTASESAIGDGWIGKYLDSECCGSGKGESGRAEHNAPKKSDGSIPGISIDRAAPLAMEGRLVRPVNFEQADIFRWASGAENEDLDKAYQKLNRRGAKEPEVPASKTREESNADFLLRTAMDAQLASDQIRKAVAAKPSTTFPASDLGKKLQMIAAMIGAGLKTRVYYVSHGGFDTHAGQGGAQGRHAQLLGQFASAMKAFQDELAAQGNADRVLTMAFSEFGRRVAQNQSQGTDHGTAAPMLFVGSMVRAGVLGTHPSMKDLDEGDLRHTIDFRSAYAGVLERWMRADSVKVLGKKYDAVQLVRA